LRAAWLGRELLRGARLGQEEDGDGDWDGEGDEDRDGDGRGRGWGRRAGGDVDVDGVGDGAGELAGLDVQVTSTDWLAAGDESTKTVASPLPGDTLTTSVTD
jgi:hypothetical protein